MSRRDVWALPPLLLIIALLPPIVNGGSAEKEGENKKSLEGDISDLTLFMEKVIKEGKRGGLGEFTAEVSGLTIRSPVRGDGALPEESVDGRRRNVQVVLVSTDPPKAGHLVFQAMKKDIAKRELATETFRLNVKGVLEKAVLFSGKLDESGKPVPGTNTTSDMGAKSERAQAVLRRELDFWIKGVGRKPSAVKAEGGASKKPAVGSGGAPESARKE